MSYEWRRVTTEVTASETAMAGAVWAEHGEVEQLAAHYEARLDEMGFFFPPAKARSMRTNLRNFWSRMPMTRADVQMLHGILRQTVRWAARKD